jgi:hypothetical protein
MLMRAFENDWANNKIAKIIKNDSLRERLKEVVLESWPAIRYIFKHYAARFPPHFSLSVVGFAHLCDDLHIRNTTDPWAPCSKTGLETIFIACTTHEGHHDHSLTRPEMLEICVRMADAQYLKTKSKGAAAATTAAAAAAAVAAAASNGQEVIVDAPMTPHDIVEAFQAFKRENLDLIQDYSTNEFRNRLLYSGPIDAVFRRHKPMMQTMFVSCAKQDAGGHFMTMQEFLALLKEKGLIGDKHTTNEPPPPRRAESSSPRSSTALDSVRRRSPPISIELDAVGTDSKRNTNRRRSPPSPLSVGWGAGEDNEVATFQQVTEAQASVAFLESKLTVVNEAKHSRHSENLSFVDFLEAVARIAKIAFADLGSCPSSPDQSSMSSFMGSQSARNALAQQIEALLKVLAPAKSRRLTKLAKAVKIIGLMR